MSLNVQTLKLLEGTRVLILNYLGVENTSTRHNQMLVNGSAASMSLQTFVDRKGVSNSD